MGQTITRLERVTLEELTVLHALRQCDPAMRERLADMVELVAHKQLARLPKNVLPFPIV